MLCGLGLPARTVRVYSQPPGKLNLSGLTSISVPSARAKLSEDADDGISKLQGKELQSWEESRELLSTSYGFADERASTILKRAFGWSGKAYWRNEKKTPEIPTPDTILAVTDYLTSLGLSDDEVRGVIDSFPEVLGCSVEKRLKANVAQLERDWKMTAPVIKGVVCRRPDVLGFNIDCLGDCAGECNRCWVRF